jgi:hypothetical protein
MEMNETYRKMTKRDLVAELEARGYGRVDGKACKGRLVDVLERDDEGQVTEGWW